MDPYKERKKQNPNNGYEIFEKYWKKNKKG